MQFKHKKDFIFRRATASDRNEVLALIQKHGDSSLADSIGPDFTAICQNTDTLFDVALNSNGVVIAFLYATTTNWKELAANPNFLKQDLKEFLYQSIKDWAEKHSGGRLYLKPKMISGSWKTYVKKLGAKIELARDPLTNESSEVLIFS